MMDAERQISGGQAGSSSRLRNVPGFTWGIGGHELTYRACEQAWLLGANLVFAREVAALEPSGRHHVLHLAGGENVKARTVALAMGVSWRRLGIARLEALSAPACSMAPPSAKPARCGVAAYASSAEAMRPARRPCSCRSTPSR